MLGVEFEVPKYLKQNLIYCEKYDKILDNFIGKSQITYVDKTPQNLGCGMEQVRALVHPMLSISYSVY